MLFIVDFDGTIAPTDTVDELLQKFAPGWEGLERDWVEGRINSQECMSGQIALVRGERAELCDFLESVAIDPSFRAFVDFARTFGEVVVVSDGLDYPIRHALAKAGIDVPVFANALTFRDRGLAIGFPHRDAGCRVGSGTCKCAVSRTADAGRGMPVVLIGDGKSDQCIARIADVVFAKSKLRTICEAEGIPHFPFETFADVIETIRRREERDDQQEHEWPLTAFPI